MLLSPAVIYIVALVGFPFVIAILSSFSDVTVGDLFRALHHVTVRHLVVAEVNQYRHTFERSEAMFPFGSPRWRQ